MRSKPLLINLLFVSLIFFSFSLKENNQQVKEYLTVPGPVEFNNTKYNLSWSSHPNNSYYKQEYLPAGEKSETFTHMVMMEALTGNVSPKDAMINKVNELQQRKQTDPVTNYQFIENKATGEFMLDFVISSGNIVEWNVYRYTSQKNSKALVLFEYSRRAYGAATTNFLKALKADRVKDVNTLATFKIPTIKIKS